MHLEDPKIIKTKEFKLIYWHSGLLFSAVRRSLVRLQFHCLLFCFFLINWSSVSPRENLTTFLCIYHDTYVSGELFLGIKLFLVFLFFNRSSLKPTQFKTECGRAELVGYEQAGLTSTWSKHESLSMATCSQTEK